MEKQKNIPSLRFPEFKADWIFKNGDELFETISDKRHNSDLPILAITQEHGAIPRDLIDYNVSVTDKSIESYKVVQIGDFIISLRSFQGGIEYSNYKGICSPAYIILRNRIEMDKSFYKFYFKTERYIKHLNKNLEGIRDGKMISYKYFSEILLPNPTIDEQTKINIFLTSVDKKLQALKKKKNLLEQYKKGVMQKIFSQELRFKDENGNDYPDWERKKLGNLGECFIGLTYSPNDVVESNGTLVLRSSNVQNGRLAFEDNVFVDTVISEKNYVKENDILICARNGSRSLIGKCALISKENEGYAFGAFMSIYRSNCNRFIYHLFQTDLFFSQINEHLGATINQVTTKSLNTFSFNFPCEEEQEKVATFLSLIDDKISRTQAQLELTQQYKKGLLQNMFV
jgi:type I restriction enzyme S subunit